MSQETNMQKLYDIIIKYLEYEKSKLHLPRIKEEIAVLEEKLKYYYEAMKLIVPIHELKDEDIEDIPEELRQQWKDIRVLAQVRQKISIQENALKMNAEKKMIKNLYHDMYKKVESELRLKKEEAGRYSDENDILDQINYIAKVAEKLINNLQIDYNDYQIIKNVLDDKYTSDYLSIEDEYQISTSLGIYMLEDHPLVAVKDLPTDDEITEDIEENEELLTDEELIEIFARYGYIYDLVNQDTKEKLRRLGKVDNILEIFEIIKNSKLSVDASNTDRLARIAIYSKPEIVQTIINNIYKDSSQGVDLNNIFNLYIIEPSLFISGIKRETKNGKPIDKPIDYTAEAGYFNNYQAIRDFFIKHNVDINYTIDKCVSIYWTKASTLEDSYAKYKSYDLPDELIFDAISCLSTKDVYEKLDGLIELGAEDYYKKYISRTSCLTPETFLRIYLARKMKFPIFYERNNGMVGLAARIGSINNTELYDSLSDIINHRNPMSLPIKVDGTNVAHYLNLTTHFDTPELQETKAGYDVAVEESIYDKTSSIEENPYIAYLDEKYIEDGTKYIIDGVIISRRKVLRLMDALTPIYEFKNNKDLMMYVLTYKSLLTPENLTSIDRVVNDMMQKELN